MRINLRGRFLILNGFVLNNRILEYLKFKIVELRVEVD